MDTKNDIREQAILCGVDTGVEGSFDSCMEELERLAAAAMYETVGVITQKMTEKHRSLYVGQGKAQEIKEAALALEAGTLILYDNLSPSQIRNLQRETELMVLDRTALILEIFASRAKSREAKLQVETATLEYMLPRLVGMREALNRQAGASGAMSSRGGGEKKLELDRRKINRRLDELKRELTNIAADRDIMRKKRLSARIPLVSLVGYTNVGKSTLLNSMMTVFSAKTEGVYVEDMLFATLDTTIRRIETGDNQDFLLADTVGFIHRLPHGLVKAFRSTLEEVKNADLLLHVVDYSDENHKEQIRDTLTTLDELGASGIPMITVYNKADLCMSELPFQMDEEKIYIAAGKQVGITELAKMIVAKVYAGFVEVNFLIPYNEGNLVAYLRETAMIKECEYLEEGTRMRVSCHIADQKKYSAYVITD
ncbi:MAG: GTPase HflX [Lachnospiraceae bacterium]|jgi:GTP-binding protein HflX|nr:GTPase HflX [Lachnospiraceae bacterium]